MRIDLHTHSVISDGTDTPTELVAEAARVGLDVVALTDHDTFDGLDEARTAGAELGVEVIEGIEISTSFGWHSVHLLAYGCDVSDPDLGAELARIRHGRGDRVPEMSRRLAEIGVEVSEVEVLEMAAGAPSIGRPHFADVLVAKGYVANRAEAFDRYLAEGAPGFVPRYAVGLTQAIDLVHGAGGAAVLAHPWGRGSRIVLPSDIISEIVRAHGLDGIEVWHEDHDQAARTELHALAKAIGLIPTGSSDYHGTGKTGHPLGVNLTPPESLDRLRARMRSRSDGG